MVNWIDFQRLRFKWAWRGSWTRAKQYYFVNKGADGMVSLSNIAECTMYFVANRGNCHV
jgi:hypothetical protein